MLEDELILLKYLLSSKYYKIIERIVTMPRPKFLEKLLKKDKGTPLDSQGHGGPSDLTVRASREAEQSGDTHPAPRRDTTGSAYVEGFLGTLQSSMDAGLARKRELLQDPQI